MIGWQRMLISYKGFSYGGYVEPLSGRCSWFGRL